MPRSPLAFHCITDTLPVGLRELDPYAAFEMPSARGNYARYAWRAFDGDAALIGWNQAVGRASNFDVQLGDNPIDTAARFARRLPFRPRDGAGRPTTARPRMLLGFAFDLHFHVAQTWIDGGYLGANVILPEVQLVIRRHETRLTVCRPARAAADVQAQWAMIRDEVLALVRAGGAASDRRMSGSSPRYGTGGTATPSASAMPAFDDAALSGRLVAALAAIDAGRVAKVVVATSRSVPVDISGRDVPNLARTIAAGAPGCTAFLYEEMAAKRYSWLGATPERLVRVRGHRLWTMALAGTAPRGRDASEDRALGAALLASDKDRREHAAVVDAIRATLAADPDLDVVAAPAPRLRRLATLQHLETPITARSRTRLDVLDIARRLHPTPALAGSPREAALDLIAELEPDGRGWYGGAVGWIDGTGDGDLAVGIRGILLHDRQATAYAGAGLVAGSNVAAEAREIELKLAAALAPLSAFRR